MPGQFAFPTHPFLASGHFQTLAAAYLIPSPEDDLALRRHVTLPDGDTIVIHDNRPPAWREGQPVTLLIHGLGGCHRSPYLRRITRKLNMQGMRVFRMDQRGSGAGRYLARRTYHSGRSDDVFRVVEQIGQLTSGSPLMVCGFSLGANLTLRMLGDRPEAIPDYVTRAMAVCPPVSLVECITRLEQGWSRFYDRYFARTCLRDVLQRARMIDGMHLPATWSVEADQVKSRLRELGRHARAELTRNGWLVYTPPGSLREFDTQFTAPLAGFDTVDDYYQRCGSLDEVARIRVPTRIVAAVNDPMIPVSQYDRMELSPAVRLERVPGGGHLGFVVPSSPGMRDGCWIDASVVGWATASDRRALRAA